MPRSDIGGEGGAAPYGRHIDLDRSAAEVAESVLCEWLHWFGEEMDGDDARALERAIAAFRAAGGSRPRIPAAKS